jgi:hypothetical protein
MHVNRIRAAWLWLVTALALHVIDEAATGFLDVYNPTVRALREELGWFPMPELPFDVWATGLAAVVLGLALLTPLIDGRWRAVRLATGVFAALMVLNGAAHLVGSIAGQTVATVQFERPMPGAWSSPLLIGAGVFYLLHARRGDGAPP